MGQDNIPAHRVMRPCEVAKDSEPLVQLRLADLNRELIAGKRYFSNIPTGHTFQLAEKLMDAGWQVKIVLSSLYVRGGNDPYDYPFKKP